MTSLPGAAARSAEPSATGTFDVRLRCGPADELTVQLLGELDLATVELLSGVLRNHAPSKLVRLDLAGLTFVDCAGLRAIEQAHARLVRRGGRLDVVHAGPRVRRLLRMTGLDHLLSDPQPPAGKGSTAKGSAAKGSAAKGSA